MALKAKITKAEHDALSEAVRKEYVDNGDGEFTLDVEGTEDTGALKRALAREKQEAKERGKKAADLEAELAAERAKHSSGDGKEKTAKQIEKEWNDKYTADLSKATAQLTATQEHLRQQTAQAIATELFTVPKIGQKYVIDRIKVAIDDDGKPVVQFLHEDGSVDEAATADTFKKEIKANKDLHSILIGSKAAGGGANGDQRNGGGGAPQSKPFKDLNGLERAELLRTDPDKFARESNALRSSQQIRI
jgi:hypothetical protein